MTTPLLEVKDLTVKRGEHALFDHLSFSIAEGELLQLQGDNGSGKTTLLRALCTLIPVDNGTVLWRGEALPGARESYFEGMCFAGHSDGLKGDLTALENLQCSLTEHPASIDDCLKALDSTGLAERAHLPCRVLSAGQKRRVVLARLLVSNATLWILDEPLTALDAEGRALVGRLIETKVAGGGSVIYSTHQPLAISDRPITTLHIGAPDQLTDV